ncbi:PhzF family phenazine biosynthesis protein [Rahnella ecdela]|uniref:PhzF family phenazine biosynthesis protein n=1 Tax=Rahnella ecdela TaxID=2816250 RepID=A0ABS6LN42_9GAMM|nr:PhzF family phenazine biosynthesis protein [Rahnella ecdela]MBU9848240.1 PhzF family phenazine biosynthesis protein [Rahnella ecdela]
MTRLRRFKQVDVFTAEPLKGNALAVILDAEGLTDAEMFAMARWTNLAETAFVLKPTSPQADYRVRIFTTDKELPFAGHPTLGTAYALLQSGLQPKNPGYLIQECGVGLVQVKQLTEGGQAFSAPSAAQTPLDSQHLELLTTALRGGKIQADVTPVEVDMGIIWLVVRMESAQECLNITPDAAAVSQLQKQLGINGIAVYGLHDKNGPADYEVRAIIDEEGVLKEDPVTGSANACLARVLKAANFPDGAQMAQTYRVRQGTKLQRDGRVTVTFVDGEPWVGGDTCTLIDGTLDL